MTYNELINSISSRTGLPLTVVKKVMDATCETILEAVVVDGDDVRLADFGKFFPKAVVERGGPEDKNPSKRIRIGFSLYNKAKERIDKGGVKRRLFNGFM